MLLTYLLTTILTYSILEHGTGRNKHLFWRRTTTMRMTMSASPSKMSGVRALTARARAVCDALRVDARGWLICGAVLAVTVVRSGVTYSFGLFIVQLHQNFPQLNVAEQSTSYSHRTADDCPQNIHLINYSRIALSLTLAVLSKVNVRVFSVGITDCT